MAAETIRRPRGVARVAGHAAVGVGELRFVFRDIAPGHAVVLQIVFASCGFFVVVRIARRDRCPASAPLPIPVAGSTIERWKSLPSRHSKRRSRHGVRNASRCVPPVGREPGRKCSAWLAARIVPWQSTQSSSIAARGSPYSFPLPWRPARNGNRRTAFLFPGGCPRGARLCSNFSGSSAGTMLIFRRPAVALAVALEDGAEHPAVAVKIGELRCLQLLIELRRCRSSVRKFMSHQRPRAAAPSGLRCDISIFFFFAWDCAACRDTSRRRRLRCPTRCSRNRSRPCSCRDEYGRPCIGSKESSA